MQYCVIVWSLIYLFHAGNISVIISGLLMCSINREIKMNLQNNKMKQPNTESFVKSQIKTAGS